jgi:hypothetical protein
MQECHSRPVQYQHSTGNHKKDEQEMHDDKHVGKKPVHKASKM